METKPPIHKHLGQSATSHSNACMHKFEYINVEALNMALIEFTTKYHKHMSTFPAYAPTHLRILPGSQGGKVILSVIV